MNLTYTILLIVKWYFVLLYFVLVLFSNVYRNWGGFHDSGYLLTLMEVSSTRIVNEMNNISCTFLWSNKYISLSLSLTVNGDAVSEWPRCRWDVKHNQLTNQYSLMESGKCRHLLLNIWNRRWIPNTLSHEQQQTNSILVYSMAVGTWGQGAGGNCPPPPPNILPTQKIKNLKIVTYK